MTFRFKKAKSEVRDSSDRLTAEFRDLISASEDLLRRTAAHTGDGVDEARATLKKQLSAAQGTASQWQAKATKKYKAISSASDDFVHDNPWKAVGIAAVVGIVISAVTALTARRDD